MEEIEVIDSDKKLLLNSYYCLTIILKNELSRFRLEIIKKLNNSGIGTSIYYPQPVPRMKYYQKK
jgi:dTDP-4-amino-4,6-dideoxygalactose transaminase